MDVIDFYLVTSKDVDDMGTALDEFTGNLKKTETSDVYYIKGVMKTNADNNYQGLTLDGITITVCATQDTVETTALTTPMIQMLNILFQLQRETNCRPL